jgi:tagatose-1,6-bisphosphate aldolase
MPATNKGLGAIAGTDGKVAVLAMDQRGSLRRMLTEGGQTAEDTDLTSFKVDVIGTLSPAATGVLTDVEYGVGPVRSAGALADGAGLLIAAEPAEKQTWNGEQRTTVDPVRNAAWVRDHGGDALKFLLYWRPDRQTRPGEPDLAAEATDAVRTVVEDCRAAGLPSVIEPVITTLPGRPKPVGQEKKDLVIASAARLAELGPDLLKLEWPEGEDGCREITHVTGRVPWALLSAGVEYEEFVQRATIALDAGACGFIAGRAIWGETTAMGPPQRREFLREVSLPRMQRLVALLGDHGRGWADVAREEVGT